MYQRLDSDSQPVLEKYDVERGRVQDRTKFLNEDREVEMKSVARWKPMDRLLGTTSGQLFLLTTGAIAVVFVGSLSWMFLSGGGNDMYNTSFGQSLWFGWGMFFDPGTQMGFEAVERPWLKVLAVFFSVVGFVYNLIFLGYIVELSRSQLQKLYERGNRYIANGHTLVLGWTEKTPFIVEELLHSGLNRNIRSPILVVADQNEDDMRQGIDLALTGKRQSRCLSFDCFKHRRIDVRCGCPQECDDLLRASAQSAEEIIIFGMHGKSDDSDLEVVQTIIALASLSHEPNGNIIASVKNTETVPVVDAILERAEGLVALQAVHQVLCLKALQPIVGDCFEMLSSFVRGQEIYMRDASECGLNKRCRTQTFGEVRRSIKNVIFIGVRYANGNICVAPADTAPVTLGDRLMILAASLDRTTYKKDDCDFQPPLTPSQSNFDFRNSLYDTKGSNHACSVIIVNWSAEIVDLLETFDKYMAPGSSVHVLATVCVGDREQRLQKHRFQNIRIVHHCGQVNEVESIQDLPLREAAAILVLGSGLCHSNANWNDAHVISCGITISDLLRSSGLTSRLICEVLSSRVQRMLKRDEPLRERATFFHSNSLEAGLVATASANRAVYNTLLMLMDPFSGNSIRAVPARPYFNAQEHASHATTRFQVLGERLRLQGHILLGWLGNGTEGKLVLNPDDKEVRLQASDQLVVIWKESRQDVSSAQVLDARQEPNQKVARAAPYTVDGHEVESFDSVASPESAATQGGCCGR